MLHQTLNTTTHAQSRSDWNRGSGQQDPASPDSDFQMKTEVSTEAWIHPPIRYSVWENQTLKIDTFWMKMIKSNLPPLNIVWHKPLLTMSSYKQNPNAQLMLLKECQFQWGKSNHFSQAVCLWSQSQHILNLDWLIPKAGFNVTTTNVHHNQYMISTL